MPLPPGMPAGPMMPMAGGGGMPPPGMGPQGPGVEQKFAAFMNTLSPQEQQQIVPLMGAFASAASGPQEGAQGAGPPPPPPPGLNGPGGPGGPPGRPPPPPPGAPGLPPGMAPTGATPPGLDPAAAAIPPQMSIGRQQYG